MEVVTQITELQQRLNGDLDRLKNLTTKARSEQAIKIIDTFRNDLTLITSAEYAEQSKMEKIKTIIDVICTITGITEDAFYTKRRFTPIVLARQMFCYITAFAGLLGPSEGGIYLDQHHSTFVHGRDIFGNRIEVEPEVKVMYERVMSVLKMRGIC